MDLKKTILKTASNQYIPERPRSNVPTATIKDGITNGKIIHLSIRRNILPKNWTYIFSRALHGSSLCLRHTPRIIPIRTPLKVAIVKAF